MDHAALLDWLNTGDAAIRYQTRRDLQGVDDPALKARIATDGWGKQFLDHRNADGTWGRDFYQPKWTSTHYTLLTLCNLGFPSDHAKIRKTVAEIAPMMIAGDGGIGTSRGLNKSDVCVNGMYLNYASHFRAPQSQLTSVVDFLLAERMHDGGFNCMLNRSGAHHSSVHSTLSVLEGIKSYLKNGYRHQNAALQEAAKTAREFLLIHRLYKSDRTGRIIHPAFLTFAVPAYWRYNILRALDYFQSVGHPYDTRMADALDEIIKKRTRDGQWRRMAAHPGQVFFTMEAPRKPSRWVTLMAMRVLQAYPQAVMG